jgi:sialic acid synthase SpsE
VDFVKFQKRDLTSVKNPNAPRTDTHCFGRTNYEHRKALEFDNGEWEDLALEAKRCGVGMFATPFDVKSLDFCVKTMKFDILKLGSTQIHDAEVMQAVHGTARCMTVVLSTGMCDRKKIADAARFVHETARLVIMQTTSAYPCNCEDVHLNVIPTLKQWYNEVGLSGHYVSGSGAIEAAAVAMGATWIERHFTLDRTWKGTDQSASLEPSGLMRVVKSIRSVEDALGSRVKAPLPCELPTMERIGLC